MELEDFGLFIAKKREENGFASQRQFAIATGVSNGTIARIEAGTTKPSPSTLKKIAKHLKNVDYNDLMAALGYVDKEWVQPDFFGGYTDKDEMWESRIRREYDNLPDNEQRVISFDDYLSIHKKKKVEEEEREILAKFSTRLNWELTHSGLSLEEVAQKCDVTPEYILKLMEKAEKLPGVRTLYKLAELFKVTPDYLAGFTDDPDGVDARTPKPKDMIEFLDKEEVMLNGKIFSPEDREKIKDILSVLFLDSKSKNRRS